MKPTRLVSDSLATFVSEFVPEAIPEPVRERAKLLALDAIGIAYASTRFEFAQRAHTALSALGGGDAHVIGMPGRLALRDAVLMNGILVHGLDYDDTYLPGSVHLSASCVPAALGMAAHVDSSGTELLTACVLGLETGARLGAAGKGGFLRAGFHGTSMAGTFACTLISGRLMQLGHSQLMMAQGIALSTVSGTMQPMQDGSWTKRMHPGWSGVCGITAASLAQQGFVGPSEAYEGRFGLFSSFLGEHAKNADLSLVTDGLGERWEFPRASVKLFPACHQSHAFMNAAIELRREHRLDPENVESIQALVTEAAIPLVCEPLEAKRQPDSSYAAQFSLPYAIASCLVRGKFGLEEIEEASYSDPGLLKLARKVTYEIDPNSGFPKYRSGEVVVRMKDGRKISRRENILPDEPAAADSIAKKFIDNATLVMSPARARTIQDMVMNIEDVSNVRTVMHVLGGGRA